MAFRRQYRGVLHFALLTTVAAGLLAARQAVPPAQNDQEAQRQFEQLPWAVRLGLRSHQVSQAFPVIDRLVLVPDAATYVDELAKWSPQGRWPVLIEDRVYAPMFARRFKAAQTLRRPSVGQWTGERDAKRRALESVVVRTWGGNPQADSTTDAFQRQNFVPQGAVIASTDDPAWTAAVALAAGRGQPLTWLDEDWGEPNAELDHDRTLALMAAVDQRLRDLGYTYESLGDAIDTLTLCRSMSGKSRVLMPPGRSPAIPTGQADGPFAITDVLGRTSNFDTFAVTGWIFGDETRCAYIAMCSLFLERSRVDLINTYPEGPQWSAYTMDRAVVTLSERGFTASSLKDTQANLTAWRRRVSGGFGADVIAVNTKGNADFFDLSDAPAHPGDVPILNTPAAVHFTHSWSFTTPTFAGSIGERWLAHGAYAYVGSVWEPFLGAFVPPGTLSDRWTNFVPFLVAARWWPGEGELSKPWRINTFGDPLMLLPPPIPQNTKPRVAQPSSDGIDLAEHVKALMRAADEDGSGRAFDEAIAALDLLGKDDIAISLWRLADGRALGHHAARGALGPLFRARQDEEFVRAWEQLPSRDEAATDMLWTLLAPKIGSGLSDDALIQLQNAIRQPSPQHDIERLAALLDRKFGRGQTAKLIERELARTEHDGARQQLTQMLQQYR